jgi:hypothetical protein
MHTQRRSSQPPIGVMMPSEEDAAYRAVSRLGFRRIGQQIAINRCTRRTRIGSRRFARCLNRLMRRLPRVYSDGVAGPSLAALQINFRALSAGIGARRR